ncbi:MAG: nucleotidyltransferase [Planctomycetes bacterium]|nr:nucleotidyltransferase [Planctomycetota bacterium]
MNPLIAPVLDALERHRLEVVVVGNSAAALLGVPVTTRDVDFAFRNTPANLDKLRGVARDLGAALQQPFLPASEVYRILTHELQLDFLDRLSGIASFEGLRARAERVKVGNHTLLVARLEDIIASKRAADRDRDRGVLPLLDKALEVRRRLGQGPGERAG